MRGMTGGNEDGPAGGQSSANPVNYGAATTGAGDNYGRQQYPTQYGGAYGLYGANSPAAAGGMAVGAAGGPRGFPAASAQEGYEGAYGAYRQNTPGTAAGAGPNRNDRSFRPY